MLSLLHSKDINILKIFSGNTWGLGGTCVNVGCIPKKLYHISTLVKENALMSEDYGLPPVDANVKHSWPVLRENVQNYIKGINFGYKNKLKQIGVDFVDARAIFKDDQSVEFEYGKGLQKRKYELKSKNFVIATGLRPRPYEGVPELKEWAITSDDLFSLKDNPGKTLIIGGGYIAIECAGFLRGIGNEVILANRSTFLRVFDQDMASKVESQLEEEGLQLMHHTKIKSVKKLEDKLFEVELESKKKDKEGKEQKVVTKVQVNNILMAIGRDPNPDSFGAKNAGLELDKITRKILGRKEEPERTNIPHIYAVGDSLFGMPELMPVAQKSGKLLAHRVSLRMKNSVPEQEILSKYSTDYRLIPTTIFSPTEYSFVGLTEE